jgi:hypothetical protein
MMLVACPLAQGCGAVGQLHTQAGVLVGNNFGDEGYHDFGETQAIAELGYVTGGPRGATPRWGFGGTGYLLLSDPMRPGLKAIARRRFNQDVSLDFSAGPMITYNSSGTFNGFTGGVALNVKFLTLRSEYVTWPFEAWDDYIYVEGQPPAIIHYPSGHEQVWFNGVSMNGTASWVVVAVATSLIIIAGANGAFE